MPETYIPLEDVAQFEGVDYETVKKRAQRGTYKTKVKPRESGKALTLVAVSSLSTKARRLYRMESKKLQGDDLMLEQLENKPVPWYVETDIHWYRERYPEQYAQAVAAAELMREFTDYDGSDRTGFAEEFAEAHDMTQRTLYRMAKDYLNASVWALKYERDTGRNHDYFKELALCRKPKQQGTFPSLDPEVKALIENIWFDERFRHSLGTVQMLYDKLSKKCEEGSVPYPSYPTVARYVQYLMSDGGKSAAYLAERGTREWKNRYMMKGERDLKALQVMEIVVGDVHTFDLWVKYTPANGRPIAVRPKLIAWLDIRSRRFVGYAMCRDSNTQDIKNSIAKVVRSYGAPMHLLIDNGKDFANRDTLGHDRNERLIFNADVEGFYKALGIQEVFRSLPFQPWDKPIERAFGTVCRRFSRWFDSYSGTLTGSRTDGKVRKDIKGMLERDELFTMEEFYALWDKWVTEVYDQREHRGLRDAGEEYTTPGALFENGDRYYKAAPPDSYIAMLLMPAKRVPVKATGIRLNKARYMCAELLPYINDYVNVRWQPEDNSAVYAFKETGELIGEIPLAEKMTASFYADEEQVSEHKAAQNRHLRQNRETLESYRTPFDQRTENADATPHLVGGVELTLGKQPRSNVVSIPLDEQAAEAGRKKKDKQARLDYYDKRGQEVLDKLNKLG